MAGHYSWDPPVALSSTQLVFVITPEEAGAIFLKLETAPKVFVPSLMVLRINPLRQSKQLK